MASIKLISRPSSKLGSPPVFYIRIIHKRACKAISTLVAADDSSASKEKAESKMKPLRLAIESLDKGGAEYNID